jgi:uncharacterized protein YukE
MEFDRPDAVSAMNDAVAAVGDEGGAWDVVGEPMTEPIGQVAAYGEKLRLRLNPSPGAKRQEVGGLAWGRIGQDVARLTGLAAAIEDISATIKNGKERLAADWTGEESDDFRAAVEKIERTLDEYSSAVRAAASDLTATLDGIHTLYDTYRDQSLAWHLTFDDLAKPADWWRMWRNDAEFLAGRCASEHGPGQVCGYLHAEQIEIINDQLVNRRLFDRLASWDCTGDPEVVINQYRGTVDDARHERTLVSGKVHNWYVATDQLKMNVDEMLTAGLENLRKIAETKVFATLTVPGAEDLDEPAADPQPSPVEPVSSAEPVSPVEPVESVEPPPAADPATISGDGWSISVTRPDSAGRIGISVDRGDGPARYALDFDAASGLSPLADEPGAGLDVTPVPAGTNGQCVLEDGSLRITAERPLFDPGTLKLEVDDGAEAPTTHTLDLAEANDPFAPTEVAEVAEVAEAEPAESVEPAEVEAEVEAPADDEPAPDEPPADELPTDEPPADEPAADEPAADEPAADEPAADEPADEIERGTESLYLDRPESLSGVLVPDQASGEAELAGASVDMWVGMGWSVHGDLFDNGDPVYSVHGVLVDDDHEGR